MPGKDPFTKSVRRLSLAAVAGLFSLAGCGGGLDLPDTSPATGTVFYRGEPVEGAMVMFSRGERNIAEGEIAMGKTDANGRFELTTHVGGQADVKGAVAGQYQVTVSKHIPPPGMSESEYQAKVEAANKIGATGAMVPPDKQPPQLREMFLPQYSSAGRTELKATVTAEEPNEFQFDLK